MSKFTDVKWKRVKDLRVYFDESIEFELKKMPPESQKRFQRIAHIVSQRFAARLIELDLKLPCFDHIFVYLSTALQPGTFQYVSNVDDWSQYIHLGVSPAVIFQSPTTVGYWLMLFAAPYVVVTAEGGCHMNCSSLTN